MRSVEAGQELIDEKAVLWIEDDAGAQVWGLHLSSLTVLLMFNPDHSPGDLDALGVTRWNVYDRGGVTAFLAAPGVVTG
jgi:hypothetical protein